jgi:hypothetical protein
MLGISIRPVVKLFACLDLKPKGLVFGKKRDSHLKWADARNPRAIIPSSSRGDKYLEAG